MIRELLKSNFRLGILLTIVAVFASCTKTEYVEVSVTPDAPEEKAPTYTIMLYGTGGGNVDENFIYNMQQLESLGKQDSINFRGLFKFSSNRQHVDKYSGTRLFTLTDEGLKSEKKFEANYRMDNPAHLTDFIKETVELMPADKYILVFWNHGTEFTTYDKLVQDSYPELTIGKSTSQSSRAAMMDDNINYDGPGYNGHPLMSVFEMEKGIHDSGIKMDLIDFNACSVGMMETYAQLKDDARYIMASLQPQPGEGTNYTQFLLSLKNKPTLEEAIKDYLPKNVRKWHDENIQGFCDLECYDMTYMDELMGYAKRALERYAKDRDEIDANETQKRKILENRYKEQIPESQGGYAYLDAGSEEYGVSTDVCSALTRYQHIAKDGLLSAYVTQMNECIEKMTVASAWFELPRYMSRVSMGINWPSLAQSFRLDDKNFQESYRESKFNKATQWYDYLSRYAGYYLTIEKSPFFSKPNICGVERDVSYYVPTHCTSAKDYDFIVRWYFDDSDLTAENKQEAAQFIEKLNEGFENVYHVLPLGFIESLKEELNTVAKDYAPVNTFQKYAPKIHVDITVENIDEDAYENDPDKDKCPLEQTLTFNYADLQAK